jgi:tetratricopeptide (TPR) repeat protein
MSDVEWGPALAVLAAGIVMGALIRWRLVSQAPPAGPPGDSVERRDLAAKLEALVSQLRELEDTGTRRTPEQLAAERTALELDAARTLIALDADKGTPAKNLKRNKGRSGRAEAAGASAEPVAPHAAAPAAVARGSSLAGFFWGVGSAAALGLLLFLVSRGTQERSPGELVTGNTPTDRASAQEGGTGEVDGADLARLEAQVRDRPDDVALRLELARLHLMRRDMMALFRETQEVLKRDSGNARALSYQSLVRLELGQVDRAEQMLEQALAKDPGLLDGYLHLMYLYVRAGRVQDAEATLGRATRLFPDRADGLRKLLGEMRTAAAAEPEVQPGSEDPHAQVAGPGEGQGSRTEPTAAGQARSVAGVLELDAAGRAAFRPGAVVFVMLREEGFGAGPPLAARRMIANEFPLAFEIGAGDSMNGQPIPDGVLVEARLDTDGDPVTRPRSDPYGREDHVKIGTRDLRLVLRPRPES